MFSSHDRQLMSSKGNRLTAITLLSLAHLLAFFSWMEFYTHRGRDIGFFEKISLIDAWWWGPETNPNWVFLIGVIFFPIFLIYAWQSVNPQAPKELSAP